VYRETPQDVRDVRYGYRQSNPGPLHRQSTSVRRSDFQTDRSDRQQAHKINLPDTRIPAEEHRRKTKVRTSTHTRRKIDVNNLNKEN